MSKTRSRTTRIEPGSLGLRGGDRQLRWLPWVLAALVLGSSAFLASRVHRYEERTARSRFDEHRASLQTELRFEVQARGEAIARLAHRAVRSPADGAPGDDRTAFVEDAAFYFADFPSLAGLAWMDLESGRALIEMGPEGALLAAAGREDRERLLEATTEAEVIGEDWMLLSPELWESPDDPLVMAPVGKDGGVLLAAWDGPALLARTLGEAAPGYTLTVKDSSGRLLFHRGEVATSSSDSPATPLHELAWTLDLEANSRPARLETLYAPALVLASGGLLAGLLVWLALLYRRAQEALAAKSREEAQRREMEIRFRRFLDLSLDLVVFGDFQGNVRELSSAWERTLGWSREEMTSRPFHELVHPGDRDALEGAVERLEGGRPLDELEIRCRHRDGSYRWLRWRSVPDPKEGLIYGVARDVTEQKRAQRELELARDRLRQSQKMEAMGRMAGGIAHDFNNLLMVISGCCENVLANLPDDSPARTWAEEIRNVGDRGVDLTSQLLDFSRREPLVHQPLDLNDEIEDLEAMLRRLLGDDVELRTEYAPSLEPIEANPSQIHQVLMNLVVNARDAMPDGGTIRVETSRVELAGEEAERDQLAPGPYACLRVSDTGFGMDEATRERIFEPFFTTKELGRGTGLGLATVYGIAQNSGGQVEVESEPGEGTTFSVYLPLAEEACEEGRVWEEGGFALQREDDRLAEAASG